MNILVGIDGSRQSDRALSWALREAALRSARVTVLNAFKVREFAGALGREVSLDAERGEARDAIEQALQRVAGDGHPSGVEVETAAVTGRGAADAILRHRGEADLIVVGSRGLGGFPGLLLGSVSHQVAAHADVPVASTARRSATRPTAPGRSWSGRRLGRVGPGVALGGGRGRGARRAAVRPVRLPLAAVERAVRRAEKRAGG